MNFYGITDVMTYTLGSIGIVLVPGPNSLFVLTTATVKGVKLGYRAACGVLFGDTVLIILTSLGAVGVLKAFPWLFAVLKYAGAAYLAYLGFQLLHGAYQMWRNPKVKQAELVLDDRDPFGKAMLISLLNPKALVFLLSFFVQFVDPTYEYPLLSFSILGAIVLSMSVVYFTVLIFVGTRLSVCLKQQRTLNAIVAGSVGALFIGFGAKLAMTSLK